MDQFQLRDVFTPALVETLAQNIRQSWPQFKADDFCADILSRLQSLSFGDRNALIRDKLAEYLPSDFETAAQILVDSLGPEPGDCELSGYDGFIIMPQCDFVAAYGLEQFEPSMTALYEMTKRFTAEGAIRPFLKRYPEQTLARLEHWAHDPSCLARRLASEGTRPRLPLAPRLHQFVKDPTPVLALLEILKTDPTLVVRRSVANNLNDIAKDNPDAVVETLQRWQRIDTPEMDWLIKHASRTLVKQGHPGALALLGYRPQAELTVTGPNVKTPTIALGDELVFDFSIQSNAAHTQNLMIDYVIHHVKANGSLSPKVFKLTKTTLQAGKTIARTKKHPVKPINTRKYYPGRHRLQLQINGQIFGEATFTLV